MDAQMIPVNNFFGHWFSDIDIRRYLDDMGILPKIIASIFISILMQK